MTTKFLNKLTKQLVKANYNDLRESNQYFILNIHEFIMKNKKAIIKEWNENKK